MGTSRKCRYRIEFDKAFGQPVGLNKKVRLDDYIHNLIDSFKIGGVNQHISKMLGYIPVPKEATLINQFTGKVVETWKHPPFMAI